MAAKPQPTRAFDVRMAGRNLGTTTTVICKQVTVNHRGDLLFCETISPYENNTKVVAGFRSGSWESFTEVTHEHKGLN